MGVGNDSISALFCDAVLVGLLLSQMGVRNDLISVFLCSFGMLMCPFFFNCLQCTIWSFQLFQESTLFRHCTNNVLF